MADDMDRRIANEKELEQVSGGKSFEEWKEYFDTLVREYNTAERRQLLMVAMREINDDPNLSKSEKKFLANLKEGMWGKVG